MRAFGSVQPIGGVLVAPACNHRSLRNRNLDRFVTEYLQEASRDRANIAYCSAGSFLTIPQGLDPAGDLKGATRATFVTGPGVTCDPPPAGYVRHGFATDGVPPDTYALYSPSD